MPELPEVEVVRRGLASSLLHCPVRRVDVRAPRLRWPIPDDLSTRLRDRAPLAIARRGKYLLLRFDDGWLLIHLGMSGSLCLLPQAQPPGPHDHVDFHFDAGILRYHDPRRFGAIIWHPDADGDVLGHRLLGGLGVEPFSAAFDGAFLYRATRGRRVAIKSLLLAGRVVVGVGNIYASECLFRAGIRPTLAAMRLGPGRCERLADAVRRTLADAIASGGTTLRDFVDSDGHRGAFGQQCLVYGRAGAPCLRCGGSIRQAMQQQRATYWCPHCQR